MSETHIVMLILALGLGGIATALERISSHLRAIQNRNLDIYGNDEILAALRGIETQLETLDFHLTQQHEKGSGLSNT